MAAPIIAAADERVKGNFSQAIQLLEAVRPYVRDSCWLLDEVRGGNLYLQQRMGKEAAEFKAIVDNRNSYSFPLSVLAHLGLWRATAISGDTAGARKSYQDFFALWKDADSDLPVLVQRRRNTSS